MHSSRLRPVLLLTALALPLAGCGDDPVGFVRSRLTFGPDQLTFGTSRSANMTVFNNGNETARDLRFVAEPVRQASSTIQTIDIRVEPESVESLEPGGSVRLTVTVEVTPGTPQGIYRSEIALRVEDRKVTDAEITLEVEEFRELSFQPQPLEFGSLREFEFFLVNTGSTPLDETNLLLGSVINVDEGTAGSWEVDLSPTSTPRLQPGDSVLLRVRVEQGSQKVDPGAFRLGLTALSASGLQKRTEVQFSVPQPPVLELGVPGSIRQGEAFQVDPVPRDSSGQIADHIRVHVSLDPPEAGLLDLERELAVAHQPGELTLRARVGTLTEEQVIDVAPRGVSGDLSVLGTARVCQARYFDGIGLRGNRIYMSSTRFDEELGPPAPALMAFDVSNPAAPALVDSLILDVPSTTSMVLSPEGAWAVIGLFGDEDDQGGGIAFVDVSDPDRLQLLATLTETMEAGVRQVHVSGDLVFLIRADGGFSIVDASDPASPSLAFAETGGGRTLPAISARGGIAIVNSRNGVEIFDVGGGGEGGSPEAPVLLATHAPGQDIEFFGGPAIYDPATDRLHIPSLDVSIPDGQLRIYDLSDPDSLTLLGTFTGHTPGFSAQSIRTMTFDESRGFLFAPWIGEGLRVFDVSGGLYGDLVPAGRVVAESIYYGSTGGCGGSSTLANAAVVDQGRVYVTDGRSGLVILQENY